MVKNWWVEPDKSRCIWDPFLVLNFLTKQLFCNFQALEVDDKDFYVCVNRDVDAKFIKDDKSSEDEDKIDQFVVKHHETITVVQGLAKTKLTNPDEWIIKIKRETSETTFFKGKEIIDKISQRQEKLERNKNNPIIQAAIAKETLKRSKEEQKIESNANQEGGVWFSLGFTFSFSIESWLSSRGWWFFWVTPILEWPMLWRITMIY